MNEQEVRALVREAVERHLGRPGPVFPAGGPPSLAEHPSHIKLRVVAGSESEGGMCVIEPSVQCTHCGFCQSYGH